MYKARSIALLHVFLVGSLFLKPAFGQERLYTNADGSKTDSLEQAAKSWGNDKEFKASWSAGAMKAQYAYAMGFTGRGIKVGVLDSGVDTTHPELSGPRIHPVSTIGTYYEDGFQFYADDSTIPVKKGDVFNVPGSHVDDVNDSHGTEVSGAIGAARDGKGMQGVAFNADVYVANTNGTDDNREHGSNRLDYGYFTAAYDALGKSGVRIVNQSWGQNSPIPAENLTDNVDQLKTAYQGFAKRAREGSKTWIDAAAEAATKYHYIEVISASNDPQRNPDVLAALPYYRPEIETDWLAVSGYSRNNGQVYNQCGVGKWWCLMAPTVAMAPKAGGGYDPRFNGTSASAPYASGALALVMERYPYLTSEQALTVLLTTSQEMVSDPNKVDPSKPLDQLPYDNSGSYGNLTALIPGNTHVPNAVAGWGLPDLQKAMNGPSQLLGRFHVNLPSGMSDVWSNDISDIALAARQKEDAAEHQSWLDTLKTKGWTQGLPSNASDSDKTAYEIGTARESAYQTRAYEGSLTKSGSGLLTLSGNNTYRGLTTVDGGELRIDGSIASGAMVNAAGRLTVNGRTADVAVNGGGATIAGTSAQLSIDQGGTVAVTNTGRTGDVLLARGFASLDGASGNVAVGNGGGVSGNGALQSLNVNEGGTVAPGHSIGLLKVTNDANFATGSTYAVELSPSGASDRIDAGGKARIANGTLSLALEHSPPPLSLEQSRSILGQRFDILNAAGGVEGQFATPGGYLFVLPSLAYGPTSVSLTVNRSATPFASVAGTDNERSVARAMETLNPGSAVYNSVLFATSAQVPQATFGQLTGEIYPAAYATLINESRQVRDAVFGRLWATRDAASTQSGAWARLLGSWGGARGAGVNGYTSSTGGFLAGADAMVHYGVRVGGLAGYSHSGVNLRDQPSSASFDSFHLGAYAAWQPSALGLRAGVEHAWHRGGMDRYVQYGATSEHESGTLNAETTQVFAETAYRLNLSGAADVEPFGQLAYVHLNNHGMAETGGAATLRAQEGNNDVSFTTLGMRGTTQFTLTSMMQLTLQGSLGWQHALTSGRPVATLAFASGSDGFSVASVPVAKDAAVLSVDARIDIGKNGRLSIGYSGSLASRQSDHTVQGNLNWKF
ncbi:autotransporter domain-containing protein [Paraburkholderia sp. BR13439]|uniref:autotransporter domain-containing protein n=1 Tax=Paraburkholderia sp. BR13439 TaxID=3236996 RepID=UPI0034CF66F4